MRSMIATVKDFLAADPFLDWKLEVELWWTSLYDVKVVLIFLSNVFVVTSFMYTKQTVCSLVAFRS